MANITVSTDIDTFLQSADNAAARVAIGADVRTDANGAFSAGDLGGNARGTNAINIQSSRSAATQVASGNNAVAIGLQSAASNDNTLAIGAFTSVTGYGSTAVGNSSGASGMFSSSSGYYSRANGDFSSASGYMAETNGMFTGAFGALSNATGMFATAVGVNSDALAASATAVGSSSFASGGNSTAIGKSARTTVADTIEIGYWSGQTARAGAIRVHGTGMVAQTIQNRSTAYGDGGATTGSEADNTVIREGIALRRNGNEILVDLNIGGTVTTLSLGTAS